MQKCLGFGEYEGCCENESGCAHSSYWCERCNKLRIDEIERKLEQMSRELGESK